MSGADTTGYSTGCPTCAKLRMENLALRESCDKAARSLLKMDELRAKVSQKDEALVAIAKQQLHTICTTVDTEAYETLIAENAELRVEIDLLKKRLNALSRATRGVI